MSTSAKPRILANRRSPFGGLLLVAIVAVIAVVLVLPITASGTGITGASGVNYIAAYKYSDTGSTTSVSIPAATAIGAGPITVHNQSLTNVSGGSTSWLAVLQAIANGTECYYIGAIYNGSTVDVTLNDVVCEVTSGSYLSIGHLTYLVSPMGTEQYGVGNVLNGVMTGTLSDHFLNASLALRSLESTDSGSSNRTISAWGTEEGTLSTAIANFAALIPSSVNSFVVKGSFLIIDSEWLTGTSYPSTHESRSPSPVSSRNSASSAAITATSPCLPEYVIGANPGDNYHQVQVCWLTAVAFFLVGYAGTQAAVLACELSLGFLCVLSTVIGALGWAVLVADTEACYEESVKG